MLSYEIELSNIIIKDIIYWKHKVIFSNKISFSFFDKNIITDKNKIMDILVKTIYEEKNVNYKKELKYCFNDMNRAKL